jgi:hypothetical protein
VKHAPFLNLTLGFRRRASSPASSRAHELLDKIGMYRGQPVIDLLQAGWANTSELAEQRVTPAGDQNDQHGKGWLYGVNQIQRSAYHVYLTKAGRAVRLKLQAFSKWTRQFRLRRNE